MLVVIMRKNYWSGKYVFVGVYILENCGVFSEKWVWCYISW